MRSSRIVDSGRRPASPVARSAYAPKSAAVLAALGRAAIATGVPTGASRVMIDTSVYEFPGDATYARYLSGGME